MSDNTNISSIQSRLKNIVLKRFKNSDSDFFKSLKFGSDFDWEKYAKAIKSNDESIFQFASGDSSDTVQEKYFMQIVNQLFQDEDISSGADIDKNSEISADELQKYFSQINSLDGNNEDISLDDIAQFIQGNNINLDKVEEAVDRILAQQEELMAQQVQASDVGQSGGSGGGGGYGNYSQGSNATANAGNDSQANNLESLSETINNTSNSLMNISSSQSSDLSDENNANLQNVPEQQRQKLVEAAKNKETAKANMDSAKQNLEGIDDQLLNSIEEYTTLVENQTQTQEQLVGVQEQMALVQTDIDNLAVSIDNLASQIGTCQQAYNSIKIPSATDKKSKAARASALNQRAILKAQIAQLEAEKAGQEQAYNQAQDTYKELETQSGAIETSLQEITSQASELKQNIDSLTSSNAEQVNVYMGLVNEYSSACSEYTNAKQEAMRAMNEAINEKKQETVQAQNEAYASTTNSALLNAGFNPENLSEEASELYSDEAESSYQVFNALHNIAQNGGKSNVEELLQNLDLTDEEKENVQKIYNIYYGDGSENSGYTEEQKQTIIDNYGSEDNFFRLLSVYKDKQTLLTDLQGNELGKISYFDLLTNPENYTEAEVEGNIDDIQTAQKALLQNGDNRFFLGLNNLETCLTEGLSLAYGYEDGFNLFLNSCFEQECYAQASENESLAQDEDWYINFANYANIMINANYRVDIENNPQDSTEGGSLAQNRAQPDYYITYLGEYYNSDDWHSQDLSPYQTYQNMISKGDEYINSLIESGYITQEEIDAIKQNQE